MSAPGAPYAAPGEQPGRALIADGIGVRLRGDASVMTPMMNEWTLTELTSASLWLRDVIIDTCDALGTHPSRLQMRVQSPPGEAMWEVMRSWTLAHEFIAGALPYAAGCIEICCMPCLGLMASALAGSAAELTLHHWRGNPDCEEYVIGGGPLPATAAPS